MMSKKLLGQKTIRANGNWLCTWQIFHRRHEAGIIMSDSSVNIFDGSPSGWVEATKIKYNHQPSPKDLGSRRFKTIWFLLQGLTIYKWGAAASYSSMVVAVLTSLLGNLVCCHDSIWSLWQKFVSTLTTMVFLKSMQSALSSQCSATELCSNLRTSCLC